MVGGAVLLDKSGWTFQMDGRGRDFRDQLGIRGIMGQVGKQAIVLGAGMVGISTGIHLLKAGWRVTLVDRKPPGSETSYGNAGVISRGSVLPVSYPGLLWDIPGIMMGRSRAVRIEPSAWLQMLGWAPAFLRNGTETRNRAIAVALNNLLVHAVPEHEALMEEAGATVRLTKAGWLKLFRTRQGFDGSAFDRSVMDDLGVDYALLDDDDIASLEPSLEPVYQRGIHVLGTASVDDPGAVCQAYARLFESMGGTVLEREAIGLSESAERAEVLLTDGETVSADAAVVAMGPWSAEILKTAGVRVPLFHERGYHRHYRPTGNAVLNRPVNDVEGAFVLAPMAAGIRLTCGVEIARRDAGPSTRLIDGVTPAAHEAFPLGQALDDQPWLGRRPSLPDSLPAIGRVRGRKHIWACFGHQHIGLTLGPVSGRLLAQMMTGLPTLTDPSPYDPARF